MNNRVKNIIYTIVLLAAMFFVWKYRQGKQERLVYLNGKTMGTTYNIKYFDSEARNFKAEIDSLLEVFNQSLSTYIKDSEISRFNQGASLEFELPYFYPVLKESKYVYELTNGAFDPTVMPLVNAWGFGPDKDIAPDSATIDSLRKVVGFNKLRFDEKEVSKKDPRVQLDFSAVAKGYGIDVVADFLTAQQLSNYYVEIGGEVACKGKNLANGQYWKVGIVDPGSDILNPYFKATVLLQDRAMATSANNFNYKVVDGVRYAHTLSPQTGYPIKHPLLSATVFADRCITADALATSFMAMGHEKAIKILESNEQISAFLIYSGEDGGIRTYTTNDILGLVQEVN